jgi:hypothetical protein
LDELSGHRRVFALTARGEVDTLGEAVRLAAVVAPQPPSPPATAAAGEAPLGGRFPAINGVFVSPVPPRGDAAAAGSRLAVNSQVLAAWYQGARQGRRLEAAQKLAIARRLVTPLSGAVVLETKEQYQSYQLDDSAPKNSIPSVPEPGVPAMLATAAAMAGLAALCRRRFAPRGA